MIWAIVGDYQNGTERVDEFDTLSEAREMLIEYKLAYRNSGWTLYIRRERE